MPAMTKTENYLRAAEFRHPESIPFNVLIMPGTWKKHREAMEQVVMRALEKLTERRWQNAKEMGAALVPKAVVSTPLPVGKANKCPNCGHEDVGVVFCALCGSRLRSGPPAAPAPMPAPRFGPPAAPAPMPVPPSALPGVSPPSAGPPGAAPPQVPGSPPPSSVGTGALSPQPLLPRGKQWVERYGRVEYRSPMDLEQEYPLRVGLLLERHGKQLLEDMRVRWGKVVFPAEVLEPILTVRPFSPYFRVSPASRGIRLEQGKDAFAKFRVIPERMPQNPGGECQLTVEFDYEGVTVKTMSLDVVVQHKFRLGRWEIPHGYWLPLSIAGSVIVSLDTAANVYQFTTGALSVLAEWLGFVLAVVVGAGLLGMGGLLWRRASRKIVAGAG